MEINLSRRGVFAVVGGGGMAALVGCAKSVSSSTVASDVQIIANGLDSIVTDVEAIPGVPSNVLDQVKAQIAKVDSEATQIGNAVSSATGLSPNVAQAFSDSVGVLGNLLTPFFPQAPTVAVAIQAATSLVQVVLNQVNGGGTVKAAAPGGMTPNAARLILEGLSKRR